MASACASLTARRVLREPMAYILGEREFWGLPFKVSPAVLVPRPDSETLIEAALALMPDRAAAMAHSRSRPGLGLPAAHLVARVSRTRSGVGLELSEEALAVAQANAEALGVAARARLVSGDWRQPDWQQRLGGPFDLLVSNPPYIEAAAIEGLMPEVARFEPRLALDGGAGRACRLSRDCRRGARPWWLRAAVCSSRWGKGKRLKYRAFFAAAGLAIEGPWKDLAGIDRVVSASIRSIKEVGKGRE